MLNINLNNIEKLIFLNPEARSYLSDLLYILMQFDVYYHLPGLTSMRNRVKLNLLNALTQEHLDKLEKVFGDTVIIDRIDYKIVKNISFPLYEPPHIDKINFNNFCVYRDENTVNITFWR